MRDLSEDLSPQQNYLHHLFSDEASPLFAKAREFSDELGKTGISLSAIEGRMLATLVKSHSCKKFVEIGTLTGYSALWIASSLGPGGKLWTFEKDPKHANHAEKVLSLYQQQNPGIDLQVVQGDAVETLPSIEKEGPFDGIFIDGNKSAYCDYLDWAEKNLAPGALILADNVFLGGSVFSGNVAQYSKKQISIMREFNERLADPKRYISCVIPTGEGLFCAIKLNTAD